MLNINKTRQSVLANVVFVCDLSLNVSDCTISAPNLPFNPEDFLHRPPESSMPKTRDRV